MPSSGAFSRLFSCLYQVMAYVYFQFEITSCLYVMDPLEKAIVHILRDHELP
ncbi:hypothetical protein DPMN_075574 [Dreissena polymorpha]|uniref:Uncharacterized protein n=1 Tax=Dreissena polymorpha TaxID=45954 RepID=A0A9D3YKM2_DREPO|nr:hypothetical protein DPMN_075574 [Dreissena polymorpha]